MAKLQSGTTIYGNASVNTYLTVGSYLSVAGNISGANLSTVGNISATGNVMTVGVFVGNGAGLTNVPFTGNVNKITNGTSNIAIPLANGSITFAVGNVANTLVIDPGSLTMYGSFATPKVINSNVQISVDVNAMLYGPLTVSPGVSLTVPTSSTLYVYGSA
jgi:hypothetical protein